MDIEALEKSPVGRLVPISGMDARFGEYRYWAFVPDPLPESVELSEATVAKIADAALAIGRLDMAATRLPNPALLVRPSLRKEAQSTSALEGTYAPLADVLEGEIVGDEQATPAAREVLNYVRAAEQSVAQLAKRPISINLLAELQAKLVEGTRGETYDAGQPRQRQVVVGAEHQPIEQARFVPPPPGDVLVQGISDWENWIHREGDTHLIVKVALGHYQFETLHPFADGNGRLGRLVMTLQFMEAGVLTHPLLNIAEWLEPRHDLYVEGLIRTSMTGDFDEWVAFISRGIKEQADVAVDRIDQLLMLRDSILERVRDAGARRGGATYRIADELIGYPIIDVPWAANRQGVSYQAANQSLIRLVELGVLQEVRRTGRTRKVFVAGEVVRVLGGV